GVAGGRRGDGDVAGRHMLDGVAPLGVGGRGLAGRQGDGGAGDRLRLVVDGAVADEAGQVTVWLDDLDAEVVADRAAAAVRRVVDHAPLRLDPHRGRAAAVDVDGAPGAERDHQLTDLLGLHAGGAGVATIDGGQDERVSVLADADGGARL